MNILKKSKLFTISIFVFVAILAILVSNLVSIIYSGTPVSEPEITREKTTIGSGTEINYAIFGDSTAVAQGAEYSEGIAVKTAEELAGSYKVTYQNFGESGARIGDVNDVQVEELGDFNPDIALIAVGSNDVTHLTTIENIKLHMKNIINKLRDKNKDVKIVFTGAASMGNVKRFAQPVRWIMGEQTKDVNEAMDEIAISDKVVFVNIAELTGNLFATNPEYFAPDNFHPNNAGYSVWAEALNPYVEQSLSE